MPVDQDRRAELGVGLADQALQRRVIGRVHGVYPPGGLGEGQLAAVDLLSFGDDAGDRPQSGRHARRAATGEGGQLVLEHGRVKVVGLAVHVDIGAGVAGGDHHRGHAPRRPAPGRRPERPRTGVWSPHPTSRRPSSPADRAGRSGARRTPAGSSAPDRRGRRSGTALEHPPAMHPRGETRPDRAPAWRGPLRRTTMSHVGRSWRPLLARRSVAATIRASFIAGLHMAP